MKPGLTGWARINSGYDLKPEEKNLFAMEYIEKQSLALDLECILRTVKLIFTHGGQDETTEKSHCSTHPI